MARLLVRNLDARVVRRLKVRAKQNDRSLAAAVRMILKQAAAQHTHAEFLAAAALRYAAVATGLITLDLAFSEMGNALWKKARRGDLTTQDASRMESSPLQVRAGRPLVAPAVTPQLNSSVNSAPPWFVLSSSYFPAFVTAVAMIPPSASHAATTPALGSPPTTA